ncbi:MAG TPA: hypothetical protein VE127_17410 [Solirubrobacteraceae bacterium]|nr:hypothetical protein [Solirubrobacteraceae bacterium]
METRGYMRSLLASVFLILGGVLNVIFGIAGIGNSAAFHPSGHYLFGDLKTWGWVTLAIGVLELVGAGSLIAGHRFGRYVGMFVGGLAAIAALLEIPSSPLWSLGVFALSLWIIHGLAIYEEPAEEPVVALGPETARPMVPRQPG